VLIKRDAAEETGNEIVEQVKELRRSRISTINEKAYSVNGRVVTRALTQRERNRKTDERMEE
jgi:hypothetical protein